MKLGDKSVSKICENSLSFIVFQRGVADQFPNGYIVRLHFPPQLIIPIRLFKTIYMQMSVACVRRKVTHCWDSLVPLFSSPP